jgi:hypothetical protein
MQLKSALESKDVVLVEVESLMSLDRGVDTVSQGRVTGREIREPS